MKIEKRINLFLILGLIIIFLAVSYFIKIKAESGGNYYVEDSLLGIIIFHNPLILGIYILIGICLIAWPKIKRG